MRAIAQRIQGELVNWKNGRGLVVHDAKPDKDAENLLYLRYAFVTLGREAHVFPAFLLDDWGAEVRGLKLYRWFAEHAAEFPRAELFGFEQDGNETQRFMREFEHYVKFPCYAYTDRSQPVDVGVPITAVFLPTTGITAVNASKRPLKEQVPQPLRRANVAWYQVPIAENYAQLLDEMT